jgi:RND family efflux transporter MFP subunit
MTTVSRYLNRRWVLGSALGVVVAGVLAMYLSAHNAKTMSDPERARRRNAPIPVRTALVSEDAVEEVIGGTSLTMPSDTVVVQLGQSQNLSLVNPADTTTVRTLNVHTGTFVKKGDPLCEIDGRLFREVLKTREAAHAAAEAQLAQVKEQVSHNPKLREMQLASATSALDFRTQANEIRQTEYDAFQKLYKDKVVSLFEYYETAVLLAHAVFNRAEATRDLERAKVAMKVGPLKDTEDLKKAQSDLEAARVALEVARHDVDRLTIRSPVDGFVDFLGRPEPCAGTVISVERPLLNVLKLDPIFVQLDLPQDRLDDVVLDQEAEVVLDSFPKERFFGKVIRISPQVHPDTRTLPVTIELSNPKNRIKAGISGFVRLRVRKTALTVPTMAVIHHDDKEMVFKVEDGRARIREIHTGNLAELGVREVRDGLKPGEEVVVFHNLYRNYGHLTRNEGYLQDGDPIDPNWRKWTRRE